MHSSWLVFIFLSVGITFFLTTAAGIVVFIPLKMAKRISSTSIRWSYILETMLPQDQQRISALKAVSDNYLRQISEKPVDLPKIDWGYYKAKISVPGMVDTFQKSYEGLKIPYPSDQGALAAAESSNSKMIQYADEQLKELIEKIESLKKELKEKEAVMKYSDMTLEELYLARPDLRIDPDNPKFFPQNISVKERAPEDH